MLEERQIVGVADCEAMSSIKVGEAARRADVALIVIGGVERGISGRGGVDGLGEGVRALEVTTPPAPRKGCLECVVVRRRIVGKQLVAAVTVQARRGRAIDTVREGVRGNGVGGPIYIVD